MRLQPQIIDQSKVAGNAITNSAEKFGVLMYDVTHPERSDLKKNNNQQQYKNPNVNDMPDT